MKIDTKDLKGAMAVCGPGHQSAAMMLALLRGLIAEGGPLTTTMGGKVWVTAGNPDLREMLGTTSRQVSYAIHRLKSRGHVEVLYSYRDSAPSICRYVRPLEK